MSDKFKVFLSWSGERSKLVARALRDWLPYIFQSVEPWMSEQDIQVGHQWFDEVGKKLKDSGYGVFCITNENLNKPWILFEAGAIWKAFEGTLLSSYTFGLAPSDIPGNHPLSQFQGTKADKEGTRKLVESINNAMCSEKIDGVMLVKLFDKWWTELETSLREIPEIKEGKDLSPKRSERDLLEDVLNTVRSLEQKLFTKDTESVKVHPIKDVLIQYDEHMHSVQFPLPVFSPIDTLSLLFQLNPILSFTTSQIRDQLSSMDITLPDLQRHLSSLARRGVIKLLAAKDGPVWRLNPAFMKGEIAPEDSNSAE